MKRDAKTQSIKAWEDDFHRFKTIYLMDYTGMNVSQAVTLRKLLKKNSFEFKVLKNRLALRALKEDFPPEFRSYFEKPTAAAMAVDEPVKLAQLLKDFSVKNKVMNFKGGMIEGQLLRPERFDEICKLGSREGLIGKFGHLMASPLVQMMRALQAPLAQMGRSLSLFQGKK